MIDAHYCNRHQGAAKNIVRDLISPAPEAFIEDQVAVIFGDKHGTFVEKYGNGPFEINVADLQETLTRDLHDWGSEQHD